MRESQVRSGIVLGALVVPVAAQYAIFEIFDLSQSPVVLPVLLLTTGLGFTAVVVALRLRPMTGILVALLYFPLEWYAAVIIAMRVAYR